VKETNRVRYLHYLKKLSDSHHILIIDEVHPVLLDMLENHSVIYRPHITLAELEIAIQETTILIVRTKLYISASWMAKATKLRVIGRLGSGMDNIDTDYAEEHKIICFNAPEGNRNAVAEQTVGMMLSLLANINKGHKEILNGIWDRKGNEGVELANLCVGIIGYGNVGRVLAAKLVSFGCKVIAYDLYTSGFGSENVQEVGLKEIQDQADIISLHVPLNKASEAMIDKQFIDIMKKPFYLLNLSRGKVCVLADIIGGLESNKIRGVALDVLPNELLEALSENEKKELAYLGGNNGVILTPHIGGLTKDSFQELAKVLGNKIVNWMGNHPLVNPK
jgi:D-3-phosphoglycerate dehydrogenase / 2-oxoglutarate reductase